MKKPRVGQSDRNGRHKEGKQTEDGERYWRRDDEEEGRGRRTKGATDRAGMEELGRWSREGRNLDRGGHGRVRKETEQGKRREIGRHK